MLMYTSRSSFIIILSAVVPEDDVDLLRVFQALETKIF